MYKTAYLFLISLLLFVVNEAKAEKNNLCNANLDTDSIPVILGVHIEHKDRDSLNVKLIAEDGTVHFEHQGTLGWGMALTNQKIIAGKYKVLVSWLEDGVSKKTQKEVLIKAETEEISINIELANEPEYEREHNAIFLDQYTKPLASVNFKRKWNPQKQFNKDSMMVPNYVVTNNHDSMIYGAYLRFSSQLTINWVQAHSIAFMNFEVKYEGRWVQLNCSAPRIRMKLPKGKTGKTLTDMVLGGPVSYFEKGKEYRVRIDYMIDDRVFEENSAKGKFEDNLYIEQTIYKFTDEFAVE